MIVSIINLVFLKSVQLLNWISRGTQTLRAEKKRQWHEEVFIHLENEKIHLKQLTFRLLTSISLVSFDIFFSALIRSSSIKPTPRQCKVLAKVDSIISLLCSHHHHRHPPPHHHGRSYHLLHQNLHPYHLHPPLQSRH